ncbi:hypothetical protein ACFO3J_24310 [Streptomyces polygonati]|uniref:Transposase n=1 Tax=Streptomyces polygonati TaxID=1617087 RepID=A0ABV8HXK8_9ACTN
MTAATATQARRGPSTCRPARPGGAAYWERVEAIVDQAPPLTDEQRLAIRLAIWGGVTRKAAA